jgi:hypothetical protein
MSAMKMDFICKDSPETKPAPPPNANAKLSNLLNSAAPLDESEGDDDRVDEEDVGHESEEGTPSPPPPPPSSSFLPPHNAQVNARGVVLPPLKKMKLATPTMASEPVHYIEQHQADVMDAANGVSDNENSEDEQVEYAPWDDIDLNPAVDLVRFLLP